MYNSPPMCSTGRACHTLPLSSPGNSYTILSLDHTMLHSCTDISGHNCNQNIQGYKLVHSMSHDNPACSCSDQWQYHKCHALYTDTVGCNCNHSNQICKGVDRCNHGSQVDIYKKRCCCPQSSCHH